MNTRLIISFLLLVHLSGAQSVTGVYKIHPLLDRIQNPDTTYILNFWATWCKPCVEELPAFDSLQVLTKNTPVKIILVSLDFKEELDKKVNPFLKKKHIQAECVLLDEINGNDFINQINKEWSGAIPATLIKTRKKSILLEKKISLKELTGALQELSEKN